MTVEGGGPNEPVGATGTDLTAAGGHGAVPTAGVPVPAVEGLGDTPRQIPSLAGGQPDNASASSSDRRNPEASHNVIGHDVRPRPSKGWPLWEVFVRARRGLNHQHVGSLHAPDATMALRNARDVYTRRGEGVSLWVVRTADIATSSPDEKDPFFDPALDKAYRHPTFYEVPEGAAHL